MASEEIEWCNACTDLVSLKKNEAFLLHLLNTKQPGEWLRVRDVCLQVGVDAGVLPPELFATWLADPTGQEGLAVILFYEQTSLRSLTAHYNRGRLVLPEKKATGHSVHFFDSQPPGTECLGSSHPPIIVDLVPHYFPPGTPVPPRKKRPRQDDGSPPNSTPPDGETDPN